MSCIQPVTINMKFVNSAKKYDYFKYMINKTEQINIYFIELRQNYFQNTENAVWYIVHYKL